MRTMRQQEYHELQDIKRNLAFFVVVLLAIMSLMVISADASEECISWEWRQTGSHTECSGWFCWTVPEYSFVCTGYAPEKEPEPIIIQPTQKEVQKTEVKPSSIGFAYTFGHNDTDRYQEQKKISNTRAIYIMENIAWSYGLYPDEFEKKYGIK
jgi:hypothetical protein